MKKILFFLFLLQASTAVFAQTKPNTGDGNKNNSQSLVASKKEQQSESGTLDDFKKCAEFCHDEFSGNNDLIAECLKKCPSAARKNLENTKKTVKKEIPDGSKKN